MSNRLNPNLFRILYPLHAKAAEFASFLIGLVFLYVGFVAGAAWDGFRHDFVIGRDS